MAKNRRIKTYKKIYSESRISPLSVVLIALGTVALAVVGWSIYIPVYDFVMGIGEERPWVNEQSSNPQSGIDPQSDLEESQDAQQPQSQPEPATDVGIEDVRAVYMPAQYASGANRVEAFISSLPAGSYNTILVDLKDSDGNLHYKANVPLALEAGALPAQGMDASAIAGRIRDAGYRPAAYMQAFCDRVLPGYNRDAAVKYMDTDWVWLDNSRELGGKSWLNPYSDIAQNYIIDIASDLARGGFELIVVDSVQFPSGVGLDKAGYGNAETHSSRSKQLEKFGVQLSEAVTKLGSRCAVYVSLRDILSPHELIYGGAPAEIFSGLLVVGIIPSDITPGTIVGDTVLNNPEDDPARTIAAAFAALPNEARGRTIAWLQGFEAGGAASAAFVSAQTRGIPDSSPGYMIYNPQGAYR